ncbi:hypothetical protein [Streptomyces sp. AP-93]|uniref:hypothetical protein n=1 Tax=Streptomyces sp. AP-93 TaxID=2929048 RepID=UPI001FAF70D5|nr:hypothetical protein [Streptomyces sp. AP-93]MCJ0868984.1 hypothetical protein [Streptomyces sp. AP-93]
MKLHDVLGDKVPVCIVYGEHDSVVNTASSDHWLKHGKVEGETKGSFHRDEDGALTPLE